MGAHFSPHVTLKCKNKARTVKALTEFWKTSSNQNLSDTTWLHIHRMMHPLENHPVQWRLLHKLLTMLQGQASSIVIVLSAAHLPLLLALRAGSRYQRNIGGKAPVIPTEKTSTTIIHQKRQPRLFKRPSQEYHECQ